MRRVIFVRGLGKETRSVGATGSWTMVHSSTASFCRRSKQIFLEYSAPAAIMLVVGLALDACTAGRLRSRSVHDVEVNLIPASPHIRPPCYHPARLQPSRSPQRRNRYADVSSADAARCHDLADQPVDQFCFGNNIWKLLLERHQSDLPRILQGRILRQGFPGVLDCWLQGEMLRTNGHDVAIAITSAPLRRLVVFVTMDLPHRRA